MFGRLASRTTSIDEGAIDVSMDGVTHGLEEEPIFCGLQRQELLE